MKNTKGFTLIELLVVVLIIGILASIALPQYFKAVERARAAEALTVFSALGGAQQRYYLINDNYSTTFGALDIDFVNETGNPVTAGTYSTRNFDFQITNNGTATATRNSGRFNGYAITKNFESGAITCNDTALTNKICASIGINALAS